MSRSVLAVALAAATLTLGTALHAQKSTQVHPGVAFDANRSAFPMRADQFHLGAIAHPNECLVLGGGTVHIEKLAQRQLLVAALNQRAFDVVR